jgi:hypothetical protein
MLPLQQHLDSAADTVVAGTCFVAVRSTRSLGFLQHVDI